MPDPFSRLDLPPGAVVFREGEVGDCAYVIERGEIAISALRQGREVVLARLGEGELFGEMALIDKQVRSASARAVDSTTLVLVNRDQVRSKIEEADPLLNLVMKVIMDRLRLTNRLVIQQGPAADGVSAIPLIDRSYDKVRERAMNMLKAEQELQRAVDNREFELYFQPIVAVASGATAGFESLVRWRHEERGMVPPTHFIGLAERTGLIIAMGLWVLENSCFALTRLENALRESFPADPPAFMGVNLSVRQILDPTLPDEVQRILDQTGVPPGQVKLEVTESVLMEDPDTAVAVLNRLKDIGVELAVDDFGTGYSSLSYLRRFPIDVLKVDQSFVKTMLSDTGNLKIVRAIVSLASELGLRVVAEGIERPEELAMLRDLGCDYGQGYLFSIPMTLAEADRTVRQRLV